MPAPTVPPAPPRLSMITWRPSERVSTAVSGRAKASVPPPAGKGTTKETGRFGQPPAWARAEPTNGKARAAPAAARSLRRPVRAPSLQRDMDRSPSVRVSVHSCRRRGRVNRADLGGPALRLPACRLPLLPGAAHARKPVERQARAPVRAHQGEPQGE